MSVEGRVMGISRRFLAFVFVMCSISGSAFANETVCGSRLPVLGSPTFHPDEVRSKLAGKAFLILGPAGGGKGTQGKIFAERYGLHHFSSGDEFRAEIARGTELGKAIEPIMKSGELLPKKYVISILDAALGRLDLSRGIFLDGVIRSLEDAQFMEPLLRSKGVEIAAAIELDLSEERAIERLSQRRVCPKCREIYHLKTKIPKQEGLCDFCSIPLKQRDDDSDAVAIRERLQIYRTTTRDVLNKYRSRNLLRTVDGDGDPEVVHQRILSVLLQTGAPKPALEPSVWAVIGRFQATHPYFIP